MEIHRESPYQARLHFSTPRRDVLIDVTEAVTDFVVQSGMAHGPLNLYAQGATAAIMVQENWDDSVREDVIDLLDRLIPQGVWRHDDQDGNGGAHLKAGSVGPSEPLPVIDAPPALSTWQNLFFCEFDGPRGRRSVQLTLIPRTP